MPRDGEAFFCDRCVRVMKVPGQGRKGTPGAVAVAVLTEDVMWCQICVNRHGLPPQMSADDSATPSAATPAPAGGPLQARDDKESAKEDRPVRRPARPRPKTRLPRSTEYVQAGVPQVAKAWAEQMPGPQSIHRPSVAEKYGRPAPAPISAAEARARRLEFAQAYALKHGHRVAPPSRRGIVAAEEIAASVAEVGESAAAVFGEGQLLTKDQAADYLGINLRTFLKWKQRHGCPIAERVNTGSLRNGAALYRMEDLEAMRAAAEKPTTVPAPKVAASPTRAAAAPGRVEDLYQLLVGGMDREEAAKVAGYSGVPSARAAAHNAGREDVRELLRSTTQASRAEVDERIRVLEELIAQGDSWGDAWERAGWSSRDTAERSLHRRGRNDLASWLRTGNRPSAASGHAA